MRKRLAAALIAIALPSLTVGCLGKVKYPTYYTLELPAAPDPPGQPGTRPTVAVRKFRSADYLRQGAIVYRASPEEVGFYNYQRWAVNPSDFVTRAIMDRLRASGKFGEVTIYDGRANADFVVTGRLEKLDEIDYQGGVNAEVALSAQMTDFRSGKTVWTGDASRIEKVDKRTVVGVVVAMNSALDGAIQKLLASLTVPATNAGPFGERAQKVITEPQSSLSRRSVSAEKGGCPRSLQEGPRR
jgi:ABC-type uncharacterized transport system auxiliary subunit